MDSLSDVDTAELVARVRGGDQSAWTALTDRYTNLLWSVARGLGLNRSDAADVVQTTWLRLVERLDTLREPDRLGSWLATTVRRESLATLRRGARVRVGPVDEARELPASGETMDEMLVRAERDAALWRAFGALAPRCQVLLRALMADPAPSYADVSVALDMPIGSIGPTRQRCLGLLRKIWLAGAEPPEPNLTGRA